MSARLYGASFYVPLPAHLKLTLQALADEADDDGGNCFPAMDRLVVKTSASDRTVRRNVAELEKKDYVQRTVKAGGTARVRTDRRPNSYQLNADRIASEAAIARAALLHDRTPASAREDERPDTSVRNDRTPASGTTGHQRPHTQDLDPASDPSPSGGAAPPKADAPTPEVRELVAHYVESAKAIGVSPTRRFKIRVGGAIRELLLDGKDPKFIKAAVEQVAQQNKSPQSLVYVVADLERDVHTFKTGRAS